MPKNEKVSTVYCCGEQQTGKFCKDCGKQLQEQNTLRGLLEYLRKRRDQAERSYNSWKHVNASIGVTSDKKTEAEKEFKQWDEWVKQLEELLE